MTPQEKKYIKLSEKFDVTKGQINQIEGEYDFLIEKIQDSYAFDMVKMADGIISDPKTKEIFSPEAVSGIKESLKEAEDDVTPNREVLVDQLKHMNKELQGLHLTQSNTFSKMDNLVQNHRIGEFGDDALLKAQHEDAIDESQESYLGMVDILSGQYEAFGSLE